MRGHAFFLLLLGLGLGSIGCSGQVAPVPDASVDSSNVQDSAPSCPPNQVSCNGKCIDVAGSDNANCGGCGIACGNAALCMAGKCTPCPMGFAVCAGKCVDVNGDPKNCGKCNNACPDMQVCASGLCSTACPIGRSKCGTSCVDTSVDPANCGGCGIACTGNQNCLEGQCCNSNEQICAGKCTDTNTSLDHCGKCNAKCAGKCKAGQCCSTPPTGMCAHALCDEGVNLAPMCDTGCVAKICAQDGYCCDAQGYWDGICVDEVDQYCAPYSCTCM